MNRIDIQCSNCGKRKQINHSADIVMAVNKGWGSFGHALYCPKCTATWDERNSGRPMAGRENTIRVIGGLYDRRRTGQ